MSRYRDFINDRQYQRVVKRLHKIETGGITEWGNTCLVSGMQALEAYQRTHDPRALDELRYANIALLGVVDVLRERT